MWMPSSSRPGSEISRSIRDPSASTTASWRAVELVDAEIGPHVDAVGERDPRLLEQRHAPVDDPLLELEIRHAEPDQPARSFVALVDDDAMPGGVELLGRGQAGRPGADDADRPACARRRQLRLRPSPRGTRAR